MQDQIKHFWRIEEISNEIIGQTDEVQWKTYFTKTNNRQPDGRYVVRLPFRYSNVQLGDSRTQDSRRFYSLQNKLNKKS